MASIRERAPKGSGKPTYSVLYREGAKQRSQTFATKKAAQEFKSLVDILGPERALKSLNVGGEDKLTVADLAEKFLEKKARDVTPRTLTDYRRDIDNWILPTLGSRTAASIDERDVQEWVDDMARTLSPKSVAGRHMILHSMFSFGRAKSRQLVDHNPCLETELPKREKRPPKGLTVPELSAILAVAAEKNPAARDLILFMGETGWRWSEAAALPVGAVQDDGRYVTVTVTQVFRQDGTGRQVLAPDRAKSAAAFRRIRLFDASAGIVRSRVTGRAVGEFVFTNSRGNRWNQNTFLRDTWPGLLRAAGLWRGPGESPTPHWLRHTHVAVLAAMGVGAPEIRRRIGHESISTTFNVYGGMVGDLDDAALARGSDLMAGRRSAPTIAPSVVGEILASDS